MNLLKKYADQIQVISRNLRAGKLSMKNGAVKLRTVALLVEQDAAAMPDDEYASKLYKMADKIYCVIEKMDPENFIVH